MYFNNVELLPKKILSDIQLGTMLCYFTVILFFNVMIGVFSFDCFLILITNVLLLFFYFFGSIFFKETALILFKDWMSACLVILCFIYMYFLFGKSYFDLLTLTILLVFYVFFDVYYLYRKNGCIISKAIEAGFEGKKFNYISRENYRLEKLVIQRSLIHKFFYIFIGIFLILGLFFKEILPYIFSIIGLMINGEYNYYDFMLFIIGSFITFIGITYVNILMFFMFYFIKMSRFLENSS
ncbi:MAG: hypothetical protein ACN6NW_00760 [Acinetobacter amyesii]|uniref:hypothetical protein n=1 Tax=Acinetobacter amyesii TaxID=2942470 RepID=UPI003D007C1A